MAGPVFCSFQRFAISYGVEVSGRSLCVQGFLLSGNLYFSYIESGDYNNNKTYVCIVAESEVLRGLVTGNDQRINPVEGKASLDDKASQGKAW